MSEAKLKLGSFEEIEIELPAYVHPTKLKWRKRECLKCGRGFDALGAFNRVCLDCRRSPVYYGASQLLDFFT